METHVGVPQSFLITYVVKLKQRTDEEEIMQMQRDFHRPYEAVLGVGLRSAWNGRDMCFDVRCVYLPDGLVAELLSLLERTNKAVRGAILHFWVVPGSEAALLVKDRPFDDPVRPSAELAPHATTMTVDDLRNLLWRSRGDRE